MWTLRAAAIPKTIAIGKVWLKMYPKLAKITCRCCHSLIIKFSVTDSRWASRPEKLIQDCHLYVPQWTLNLNCASPIVTFFLFFQVSQTLAPAGPREKTVHPHEKKWATYPNGRTGALRPLAPQARPLVPIDDPLSGSGLI